MNCKECLHFPICALSANPDEVACDYFYANQKTGKENTNETSKEETDQSSKKEQT